MAVFVVTGGDEVHFRFLKGKHIRICTQFQNMSEEGDIILGQKLMFIYIAESQESL